MWNLNFLIKGGPVMIPILLGSIFGLAIVLEKIILFIRIRPKTKDFPALLFRYLKNKRIEDALSLCAKNSHSPIAFIFKVAIERRYLAIERLEKILEQSGNNQLQRLERHLGALASIISIEPLLGFLGTISGLIKAFMSWEKAGANISVSLLASGIYEAMITTAFGLGIAIPLYLIYNYFINRIKYMGNELTNYALQIMELFSEIKQR